MRRSSAICTSVARLAVATLLTSALVVVANVGPAAAEDAPSFLAKWGSAGGLAGRFSSPSHLTIDGSGHVFVVDTLNNRVQKFSADGTFLTSWGTRGAAAAQFNLPRGVAVDQAGDVYVADTGNHRIQKFTGSGAFIGSFGTLGSGNSQFNGPRAVAIDAFGNIYVGDGENHRIQKFNAGGSFLAAWGSSGPANGQFRGPQGLAINDAAGTIYVADSTNNRIQQFTTAGAFVTSWGGAGSIEGEFANPTGVALDVAGNVYVADYNNHRIQKFTSSGVFVSEWGARGNGNGQFIGPYGVAVALNGDVYVSDSVNERIQVFGEDTVSPVVAITSPPVSATYALGQVVLADYDCTDNTDPGGVATCAGNVADGAAIDTATAGTKNFTVNATDDAGNPGTLSRTYTVAASRPDARIKRGATGALFGDGVYNSTGAGQTRPGSAPLGAAVTYFVSVQNDATFPEQFRLKGTSSTGRFNVRYSVGGASVTSAVSGGTYTTPVIAPGAAISVKVTVTVASAATAGSSLTGSLTATSTAGTAVKDTVRFITSRA